MKDKKTILYIVTFLLILIVPLVHTNTEEGYVSELDNRVLMDAPHYGEERFTEDLELYLQDRIGFRNQMLRLYDIINDVIGGELTHPFYSYGKHGYIFFTPSENIKYKKYHKTFAEMVLKMQKYCEDRGTRFYFAFNPEKSSVLREELKTGVHYDDSWVDEMLDYMEALGVNYVDNKEYLRRIHLEEAVFNRKYDAGHWNDHGCFYATNNLLSKIHEDIDVVTELNINQFEIAEKVEKHLPNSEFVVNEKVPVYTLKTSYDDVTEKYDSEVRRNYNYQHFHYLINNSEEAKRLPKVLMFQGSYYNERPQYIISRTSEYIAVHNYQNIMDLDYYFNIFCPDVVIFEVAEYTLTNAFFEQKLMKNTQWNPAITDIDSGKITKEIIKKELGNAKNVDNNAAIKLIEGRCVDTCFLNKKMNNTKNAYLINGSNVYDLENDSGVLSFSVSHRAIDTGDEVILFYVTEKGDKCYSKVPVYKAELQKHTLGTSDNVSYDENEKSYILNSYSKGMAFDYVVVQQLTESEDYIQNSHEHKELGAQTGAIANAEGKGSFLLRLKANSNIQDEWLDYKVELEDNQICYYTFILDELSNTQIVIRDFKLYK